MKIALIQTNPQSNFEENLLTTTALIRKAALEGAQLIVCPETFLFMGQEQERRSFAQNINAGVFKQMQLLSCELKVYLIAGSIDESSDFLSSDGCKPNSTEKFFNTCATFAPTGKMISLYRKLHLFNLFDDSGRPVYCESNIYKVGEAPCIYQIGIYPSEMKMQQDASECHVYKREAHTQVTSNDAAYSFPMNINSETWDALNIICYDIRFPEVIRYLNKPCDVIFVPAAFTWQTGNDHWEILLRARAIENQCFVVACNQTGFSNEGQKRTFGNSMVIDPWGKIISRLGEEEDILFCEISKSDIKKSRAKIPALQDRKIF